MNTLPSSHPSPAAVLSVPALGTASTLNDLPSLRPLVNRFWDKVDKRGPDECWNWQAYRNPKGYGRFPTIKGRYQYAHRTSWLLMVGPIPAGHLVCHHCDNPSCVNPRHLFIGTNADNVADMVRKGRSPRRPPGEENHQARLTEEDVRTMREEYADGGVSTYKLGRKYGVSAAHVSKIVNRKKWKHIV